MIDLPTFKETIHLLDQNKIGYWVFGGFALDGMRRKISREHHDIDLYIQSSDLQKFIGLYESRHCKCYKRENVYFVESASLNIGIVILTKEEGLFVANGNKTLVKYPREMFAIDRFASIEDVDFRIVPTEVLALEAGYSKYDADKLFGLTLKFDSSLFKKIEVIKIRDSKSKDTCRA